MFDFAPLHPRSYLSGPQLCPLPCCCLLAFTSSFPLKPFLPFTKDPLSDSGVPPGFTVRALLRLLPLYPIPPNCFLLTPGE